MAVHKQVDLGFALGYSPFEFRDTLHMLGDGRVDPRPLLTGSVGLEGVDAVSEALSRPDTAAKILIDPRSPAAEPSPV